MATVTVKGVDALAAKLAGLKKKASPAQLKAAVHAGALIIEGPAKAFAPVLTGNLRRSIHSESAVNGDGAQARVGTNVEYAPYVEFGTSQQAAKAYLRRAYDQFKNTARDEIVDALQDMVTP